MKISIDTDQDVLTIHRNDSAHSVDLYSQEAFEVFSHYWLKLGWNQKYSYTFTWLGIPIIQIPEDLLRSQEVIYQLKPDVIIETGVAHGGSIIFYASLCHLIGKGRVIGIDCKIYPHNRQRIESHPLKSYITLLEGDSVSKDMIKQVKGLISENEKIMIILDSNHTYEHVHKELQIYADLVTKGSYIVIADGIMGDLHDVPRGAEHWEYDNPAKAALDFLKQRNDFVLENPGWLFNESALKENITYHPCGWLKKI